MMTSPFIWSVFSLVPLQFGLALDILGSLIPILVAIEIVDIELNKKQSGVEGAVIVLILLWLHGGRRRHHC